VLVWYLLVSLCVRVSSYVVLNSGNLRPFNMALMVVPNKKPSTAFLTFTRPFRYAALNGFLHIVWRIMIVINEFRLGFLCFNRPILYVRQCAPKQIEVINCIKLSLSP
jgi:hypothetical protein